MLQRVQSGMSAVVKAINPIFGQQIVQLNLPENTIDTDVVYYEETLVISVSSDGLGEIVTQVGRVVDKIASLPIEDIGSNLNQLFVETTVAMSRIQALAASGDKVLTEVDNEALINSLNQTALKIGELAASYSTNSPTNREIRLLLENLNYALAELAPLLTELKNQPNILIFTGKDAEEVEPEGKQQ